MDSTSGNDTPGDMQVSDELSSIDLFQRAKAALRLGRHANPQALDQLLALLADPDWPVVEAALKALKRYRDPRIVAATQAILRRENYFSWSILTWHRHCSCGDTGAARTRRGGIPGASHTAA